MISPKKSLRQKAKAFTLIELLVVISIIAVLMGLLFPAMSAVRESANKTKAKNDEVQMVAAIKAYYAEYGKYPTTSASDVIFGVSPTNDQLFDVLRNNTNSANNAASVASLNPRGIVFIEAPSVKNINKPTSGVMPNGSANAGVWYDPWGSPYNIAIDADYDNQLNGTTKLANFYTDVNTLQTGVIVWAFGKNHKLGGGTNTGFDSEPGSNGVLAGSGDVASWQ